MADNNNNQLEDNNTHLLHPNKNIKQRKQNGGGFRKIFSEMVRQAKSPKLPRFKFISTQDDGDGDEALASSNVNNTPTTSTSFNDNSTQLASLPRRRVQSTSSARSMIYRRRQPSLNNKELEKIAMKYKQSNTTPPPSRREDENKTAFRSHQFKYKTWNAPPLNLSREHNQLNTGLRCNQMGVGRRITTTKNTIPTLFLNANKMDNDNFDNSSKTKISNLLTSSAVKNVPKLPRQHSLNQTTNNSRNSNNNNSNNQGQYDNLKNHNKRFTKSQSVDQVSTTATTTAATLLQKHRKFEKILIQSIVKAEINTVIGQQCKYEEILVQKWSKDICSNVRDHIRLQTGRYVKIVVNSMIGSICPPAQSRSIDSGTSTELATCNILSSIQASDQFVVTVVKNEELFISVWVLISP